MASQVQSIDVFVSYKSENANVVRPIAEALLAEGVSVWFAEYEILLQNYDQFQPAIDSAIARSDFFLLFSNDKWADSEYCQLELEQFLARDPTASRIIEICVPREQRTHERYPALSGDSLSYSGDIASTLEFIAQRINRPLAATSIPTENEKRSSWIDIESGCELGLDIQRFAIRDLESQNSRARLSRYFVGEIGGHPFRMMVFASPDRSVAESLLPRDSDKQVDDRQLYGGFRHYAQREYVQPHALDVFGLHLIHTTHGAAFALSYVAQSDSKKNFCRRYAIPVTNGEGRPKGEIDIEFAMETDNAEDRGEFYQCGKFMDAIACSLSYTEPDFMVAGGFVTHVDFPFPIKLPTGWEAVEFGRFPTGGVRLRPKGQPTPNINIFLEEPRMLRDRRGDLIREFAGNHDTNVRLYEYTSPSSRARALIISCIVTAILLTLVGPMLGMPVWMIALFDALLILKAIQSPLEGSKGDLFAYHIDAADKQICVVWRSTTQDELNDAIGDVLGQN